MKKISILFVAAGFIGLAACGMSAEEKAGMEAEAKSKMDSLFSPVGEYHASDSITTPADTAKPE